MQLGKLDHVNIRTAKLEKMTAWYQGILGMTSGDRPNFPFPGAWMYADGTAAVHLIGTESEPTNGTDLKLEHFAFSAKGFSEFKARLDAAGERYEERDVPGAGLTQINIWDPDGNHIHIDFSSSEKSG